MPLTDTKIKSGRPGDKAYKLFDGGGLHLIVNPKGSKLWRLKYRHLGKEKLLSFGPYPTISLKKARKLCDQAKGQILDDTDPSLIKQKAALSDRLSAENSFAAIAGEYLDKLRKEGKAKTTIAKLELLIAYRGR